MRGVKRWENKVKPKISTFAVCDSFVVIIEKYVKKSTLVLGLFRLYHRSEIYKEKYNIIPFIQVM